MSEESYTLDSSFVIRILTRDPLPLFERASDFMNRWEKGTPGYHVPDIVLAEAYFALQQHYGFTKADAISVLQSFRRHPAIRVTPHAEQVLTLKNLYRAKPGFVDRLIHGEAVATNHTLVTFEKSAKPLPKTLVLA